MQNRLKKRLAARNEGGFTLIELLIVIVILGILAAIVVFAVGSTRKDAVAGSCKTDVTTIQLAAEAGKTKLGHYPTAVEITDAGGGLLKSATITQSDYSAVYAKVTDTSYTITFGIGSGGSKNIDGTVLGEGADASAVKTACTKT